MHSYILHITTPAEWEQAQSQESYKADSLTSEGFIHCSTFQQVTGVVNQWFKGKSGLLLLVIDTNKLQHELKYEDSYGHGDEFPHLYGALNLDAVIDQVALEPNTDGDFDYPDALNKFSH